jgi:hypothetical protein
MKEQLRKNNVRKYLTVGIILLFVGTIIVPSIPGHLIFYDDTVPPITTICFNGTIGNNSWYISDVSVALIATDNESGVNATYYRMDHGDLEKYFSPFLVTSEGEHTITYYSVDNTGNSEVIQNASLKIDQASSMVWFGYEKIRFGKALIYANASDSVSGVDKVEFYILDDFLGIVTEPPYIFIYYGFSIPAHVRVFDKAGNSYTPYLPDSPSYSYFLNRMTGIISNVTISEDSISFHAIFVFTHYSGILRNTQMTLPNSYVGYIGKFFMNAVFYP